MKYTPLLIVFVLVISSFAFAFAPAKATPPPSVGLGQDCNNINGKNTHTFYCADATQRYFYNVNYTSVYVGHDEPSMQFLSSAAGSASNLMWTMKLPGTEPVPTQSGTSVATFETYPAFWFSLDLCDPNSMATGACTPASDTNIPSTAGNALLELQFYPGGINCSNTQWCAALNIDSLECTAGFAHCNANCQEPVNFAFIQKNGVPTGPPGPGNSTPATFVPNVNTLLMNPGDNIAITIMDTVGGLRIDVNDISTGMTGFMVASAANGFQDAVAGTAAVNSPCSYQAFTFRPEYSSATSTHIGPWESLAVNVNFAVETGHFELCGNLSCSIPPDGPDFDDTNCFSGSVGYCAGGDTDFDGVPYGANWPDGTANHPTSVAISPPKSFSAGTYSSPFGTFNFQTNVPQSETYTIPEGYPPGTPACALGSLSACTVPPHNTAGASVFYPFYSSTAACTFLFGNQQPATLNNYGKDAEYGGPSAHFFADFMSAPQTTPTCVASPTLTTVLSVAPTSVGGSVSDTATLSGGNGPTGTITFFFSTTNTCPNGGATQVGSPVTVSGNGAYSSSSHVFSTAGTYYWYATYGGDPNNNAVTSACEPLVVNPATPALTTTATPTSETVGGPALKDVAHLTGGFNPTGTITFTLSSPTSVVVDTETVPVSGNGDYTTPVGYVPVLAGTYFWVASYSGDVNNVAFTTGLHDEPVVVSPTTPALSTTLSATTITAGGSTSDMASLAGGFNPTGTITFFFSTTNTCPNGGATQVGSPVTVSGNGAYSSVPAPFSSAGNYYWYATYSGDANNVGLTSACEPLLVKAAPTLTTTLSSTTIAVGGSVSDSAALSGLSPTGTITFFFSTTNACPNVGGATQVGSPVTVSGNGAYSSSSQTFSTAGTYFWYAVYSGDANNNGVTSACEPLVVNPASPALTTTATPTSETVGGPALKDIAHLTGGFNPTGTITFTLFSPSSVIVDTETVPVSGNGDYATPVGFVPTVAGTYQWVASYSGDVNNIAFTTTKGSEPVVVSAASPSLSTLLSSTTITAGQTVSDTATLSGGFNPTGTMQFFVSTTNACPNEGGAPVGSPVAVSGNGAYTSSSMTFNTPGTYYWYATYSGDANNARVTSACEPLIVQTIPSLTTTLSSTTITAGGSVSDFATLSGATSTATGTITFFVSTTNTCPNAGAVGISSTSVSGNGVYSSSLVTINTAGTYYWYATYSGDANNSGAQSACEPLVVKATPQITTALSSTTISSGGSVSDTATLTGGNSPTGTITFFVSTTNTCPFAGATQVGSPVVVSGNGAYSSLSTGGFSPGNYYWYATYSGDANNVGVTSACEPLVVQAGPSISTTLSSSTITVGGSVSDTATLVDGNSPTGTITFFVSTINTCPNAGATQVGSPVTVSGNGAYTSSSQTFNTAGTYYWYATYGGDANNVGVISACEPLTVNPATPALSTTATPTSETVGGPALKDIAHLTGGFNPTGTITFTLSSPSSVIVDTETVPVSGNGDYTTPVGYVPTVAGTYQWVASYSGDVNNIAFTTGLHDEPVVVSPTTPALSTTLSATTITAGGSVSDMASLAGGFNPTGTITFFFSTTNTCPNGGATQVGSPVTVSGNGAYSSSSQSFGTAGNYYWYATYSGDANNNAVTSACEPLIVQTSNVGVPEFPTPMLITTAIAFLALAILMRTRKQESPLGTGL